MKKTLMILTLAASLTAMALPLDALAANQQMTKSLADAPSAAEFTTEFTTEPVTMVPTTLPDTYPTTEAPTEIQTETRTCDVSGYIGYLSPLPLSMYAGDTLDPSKWFFVPYIVEDNGAVRSLENAFADYPNDYALPVTNEEYAHCFTIDTSEVDMTKPGRYLVYVHTIPGETATFRCKDGATYNVTMQEHTYKEYIFVQEAPEPEIHMYWGLAENLIDGEETFFNYYAYNSSHTDLTDVVVTAEPEGIVEFGKFKTDYHISGTTGYTATMKALKPGTVTITVSNADGVTKSQKLTVYDHNFSFRGEGHEVYMGAPVENLQFYCAEDLNMTFTSSDESVVQIVDEDEENMGEYRNIKLKYLKEGNVTITASAEDGRTASYALTIHDPSLYETTYAETNGTEATSFSETTGTVTADPTEPLTETQPATQTADIIKGDVDGSGEINILDVIKLNRYLLGSDNLTPAQKTAADVDGNNEIDSNDSLMLMKYVVELIDNFNED